MNQFRALQRTPSKEAVMSRIASALLPALTLTLGAFLISPAIAQTGSSKQGNSTEPTPNPGTSLPTAYSIESEMLTYAALERAGESVANQIARTFSGGPEKRGVVILLSNSSVLDNFGIWRAEIAAMNRLISRGENFHLEEQGGGTNVKQASGLVPLDLATNALSLVQSVLATTVSASPVRGNVEDQAFAGAVGRLLLAQGIPVLMPDIYTPYSLSAARNYTILTKLERLDNLRANLNGKLQTLKAEQRQHAKSNHGEWNQMDVAQAQALIGDIDVFMTSMVGGETGALPGSIAPKSGSMLPSSNNDQPVTSRPLTAITPLSPSHLAAPLAADLFASELEVDPGSELLPSGSRWQHIVRLKISESGGTVTNTGSFLRKTARYSGGIVGTFALFRLNGELECSGTIEMYEGPVSAEALLVKTHGAPGNPKSPPMSLSGNCGPQQLASPASR
jgi:hypothetical protein